MATVAEKLAKVNKDAESRSVLDSIDRPIRPLVLELTRIGLTTRFSCCGFTYDDEEEPKSHHEHSYVMFNGPRLGDASEVRAFFEVARRARNVGWTVDMVSSGSVPEEQEWEIRIDEPTSTLWAKEDGKSLHGYECQIVAITRMTEELKSMATAKKVVEIVDGNILRRRDFPGWPIKPKQPHKMVFEKA